MKGDQPGNGAAGGGGGISRDTGNAVRAQVAASQLPVWITRDERGILPVVSTK